VEDALHVALRKKEWLRPEHRVGDPHGYMRHLLYVDPEGEFVMTAITWLPGQVSAVHGHQAATCATCCTSIRKASSS